MRVKEHTFLLLWSFDFDIKQVFVGKASSLCGFFRKLNPNIIFLIITLLCSKTLILSLSSNLLNSSYTKIKTIHWSGLAVFLILIAIMFIQFIWVHALLIRPSGYIKMNPGPKPNPCHSFSICHWNLNSLTAHNYLKVSLLWAYVAIKKFDVVCLSETFFNSSDYLMMTILIFAAITQSGPTIHQIQK